MTTKTMTDITTSRLSRRQFSLLHSQRNNRTTNQRVRAKVQLGKKILIEKNDLTRLSLDLYTILCEEQKLGR